MTLTTMLTLMETLIQLILLKEIALHSQTLLSLTMIFDLILLVKIQQLLGKTPYTLL